MADSHPARNDDEFDLKNDSGGIIDVEFIVQYLILGYAHQHNALTGNLGNIALLRIAGELGLIDPELAAGSANAYREYRRLQHAQRLSTTPKARTQREAVEKHIATVHSLWKAVFENDQST
jgi:glutamate-ammonia-ligase adenylyltransferase